MPAPMPWQAARPARQDAASATVVRFGLDAPQRPGDFGLVVENGMAWLVRALPKPTKPSSARKRAAVETKSCTSSA